MILFVLLELILFIAFLYVLRLRLKKPRSKTRPCPPGPRGLPLIGNLHQFDTSAPHIYLWNLSKKYGPIMSMKFGSVPVLVVSSPDIAKEIFKFHDLTFSNRPKLIGQHRLFYNGLEVAFARYGESWRELRKICVLHLLSNKQVQSFRGAREEEVFRLNNSLSAKAGLGQDIKLTAEMLSFSSNLIYRIAFGQAHGKVGSYFDRFDELMMESQVMQGGFFFSNYLPWLGWLDRVTGLISRLNKICKDFDEFLNDVIEDHLNPSRVKSSNSDILDLLIQLKEEKSCSIDLTWNHVKGILLDIFIAGTDTGAAAVVWAMTALMKDPEVRMKLQKEIRNLVGRKGKVTEDDIPKLPYLKAAVKETLRLYPPAPLLLPRETLEECTIQGYTIAPKTSVYINAWAIGRDPEYWEKPDEFIPERFLNANVDIMGQDFQLIPFGFGRRGCPGIAMGLANVELVLANLLYSFDWELPNGIQKDDIDTEVLPGITMHKKNPLHLVPKEYKYA